MISLLSLGEGISYEERKSMPVPDFFHDLQIDYIVKDILEQTETPELAPYFYGLSQSKSEAEFRQEICKDVERPEIRLLLEQFLTELSTAVRYLGHAEQVTAEVQKWKWNLDGICMYYQAMENLCHGLNESAPASRGLFRLHERFYQILGEEEVLAVRSKAQAIQDEFAQMGYQLVINKDKATLLFGYDEQNDYCREIRKALYPDKDPADGACFEASPFGGMELAPLEAFVLEHFRKNNRLLFKDLETFSQIRRTIVTQDIIDLAGEIRFYLTVTEYFGKLQEKGFPMNYPQIVHQRELYLDDCYDLALAIHHSRTGEEVIWNDVMKSEFEKAIFVTGPNQGGKTTLARAFGQAFYFGNMGFAIAGKLAKLPFVSGIFTLFATEQVKNGLESRLEQEIRAAMRVLKAISGQTVVIMNELFTAAPTADALAMGRDLCHKLYAKASIVFCVTHTFELVAEEDQVVSLVATVVEDGSFRRTYRMIRKAADGVAYANSIADKYKLDYEHLRYRITKQHGE